NDAFLSAASATRIKPIRIAKLGSETNPAASVCRRPAKALIPAAATAFSKTMPIATAADAAPWSPRTAYATPTAGTEATTLHTSAGRTIRPSALIARSLGRVLFRSDPDQVDPAGAAPDHPD